MTGSGRSCIRRRALWAWVFTCAAPAGLMAAVPESTPPAVQRPAATASQPAASAPTAPVTTAPATTAAARKPTVDEILAARQPVPFDFANAAIGDVLTYVARSFDIEIVNKYELKELVYLQQAKPMSAREVIGDIDAILIASGYTLAESVRGERGGERVVLTVVPTKGDAGRLAQFFNGNDPAAIPEDDSLRTQVFTFSAVDPDMARNMIQAVVGKQANVEVNTSNKTIVITDTGAHVHTAAMLLQELERQAAGKK